MKVLYKYFYILILLFSSQCYSATPDSSSSDVLRLSTKIVLNYSDMNAFNNNYSLISEYENKLVYIDTRDRKLFEQQRISSLEKINSIASAIEAKGAVFVFSKRDNSELTQLLNVMFPNKKIPVNGGPFLIAHIDLSKEVANNKLIVHSNNVIVDFSGLSETCLSNYVGDIEQAILKDNGEANYSKSVWRLNSLACKGSNITLEKYSKSIENLLTYIRSFRNYEKLPTKCSSR